MILIRALGWLLVALALATAVHDALTWWSEGALRLLALGELWARLDIASLNLAQAAIQRYVRPELWSEVVRPVLLWPALPVFYGLGLIFLWLGRRRAGRAPAGFVMGSRPPRKRRGRTGL